MTRTERATFPRALIRDRSESKSGLDKSFRKGGGGNHNWGSVTDERYLEDATFVDGEQSSAAEQESRSSLDKSPRERRSNSLTDEEKRFATNFRKTAFKGEDIDLSAIARTSGAVSSAHIAVPMV